MLAEWRRVERRIARDVALHAHPDVTSMALRNGLRCARAAGAGARSASRFATRSVRVMRNQYPRNRFFAHLSVNVGSINEAEWEQGVRRAAARLCAARLGPR